MNQLKTLLIAVAVCSGCGPVDKDLLPLLGSKSGDLSVSNIRCTPDYGVATTLTVDQNVLCLFDIETPAGRTIALSCEDAEGTALDCTPDNSTTFMTLTPFSADTQLRGLFNMKAKSKVGDKPLVYWVVDDGVDRVRHPFQVAIVDAPAVPKPANIVFDCGGDKDGGVSVQAGATLECVVMVGSVSPAMFEFSESWIGTQPTNQPSTSFSNVFGGQMMQSWKLSTEAAEAGTTFQFELKASPTLASDVPEAAKTLTIAVQ